MTRRLTFYNDEIADRILAEVARGRTLPDICRDQGMPAYDTVRRWAAADRQGFATRLQEARQTGHGRPGRNWYSPDIADRILEGVAAGRTLASVCRDIGLPCRATVVHWIGDDHDGFAERYRQAREIGHGKPGRVTYSPDVADRIIALLMRGETLTDICQEPDMPHLNSVLNWVAENREGFTQRYKDARVAGFHSIADQLFTIVDDRSNDWIVRCKEDGTVEMFLDSERVPRARLRFDARRWTLPRALPSDYGDRPEKARRDGESAITEFYDLIKNRSRGLPSEDVPLEEEPLEDDG
jgi:terminase small subunit-like protein